MSGTFKLEGTFTRYWRSHSTKITIMTYSCSFTPLSTNRGNDISSLPLEVVGLQIKELVVLLRETYKVKVVCVCLVTPRWRNRHFNKTCLIQNNYLTVVLKHIPKVLSWLHRGFTQPSVTPFLRDGVHFNKIGQYNLYRSYRGAILNAITMF
jgi:hypothetical protein